MAFDGCVAGVSVTRTVRTRCGLEQNRTSDTDVAVQDKTYLREWKTLTWVESKCGDKAQTLQGGPCLYRRGPTGER